MNKFTKEIADILQAQIDNTECKKQNSSLTFEQLQEISNFARGFYDLGGFIPYPLKNR
jgi:hypothetical protein